MKKILLLTLFFVTTNGLNNAFGQSDCLIGNYPFNGNANDETGNGHNGMVYGAAFTLDRFGNAKSAYMFDGINDYISINDTNKLQLGTSDCTVSAWFVTLTKGRILSRGECNGSLGWQITVNNDGTVMAAMQSPANGGAHYFVSSKSNYTDGEWHFAAFTRTNGYVQLYTDGVADGSPYLFANTLTNTNLQLAIGHDNEPYPCNTYFTGVIDDVHFYKCALSPSEIDSLYHEVTGIKEVESKNAFSIYPNPLTSLSILRLYARLKNAEVVIYDVLGKEILREKLSGNKMEIEKGNLKSGIYFVKVSDNETQYLQKLIVE